MEKEEFRVDLRDFSEADQKEWMKDVRQAYKFNATMPYTEESDKEAKELFGTMGDGSRVLPPLQCVSPNEVSIGKNMMIMGGCLMMAHGGITIDDGAIIAANVQIITNNHDLNDRRVIVCRPVHICKNAWIGAGATIMPGVTIGENAVVGAATVVTKDIPANAIVAGGGTATLIGNVR